MAFLVEVSGHKLGPSQTRVICPVFYPHFSVLQNAIHERLEFPCFAGSFVKMFKTKEES